jgi:Carboxypeptidase regulatory-like domain
MSDPEAPPPAKPKRLPARTARQSSSRRNPGTFALLSVGCFLAGALLLWLMMAKAELLVRLGLQGQLYYLVLLPLGLAVAGFLFGVLRSYAFYRGKALGGVLELGGPVVIFCLVVLGGFLLPPPQGAFAVTVFVHGEEGVQDTPLRGEGSVVLDLGPHRRREAIGDRGQAHFSGIPAGFRGQTVPVWVEAEGFTPANSNVERRLEEGSLYLAVKRADAAIRGRVQDPDGHPIAGADLRLRDLKATADADGSFVFEIPGKLVEENLTLAVSAPGYEPWREQVVPGSNEVVVVLRKPAS